MSVHLPVLPSAGDVTAPADRFRCTRLSAVMGASTCTARQTAERRTNPKHADIAYPVCAACPEGGALRARLEGREVPQSAPAPSRGEPERERCTIAGCSRLAGHVEARTIPGTELMCGHHRGEARRHMRQRGVGLQTALAWIAAGRRPAPPRREGDACAVDGCDEPMGRVTRRTTQAWACLCGRHRIVAINRQGTRPDDTAEQVLEHLLRTAAGPRREPTRRINPADSVAIESRAELETQHRVDVLRAQLRDLRRKAAQVVSRIGSLTGRSAA